MAAFIESPPREWAKSKPFDLSKLTGDELIALLSNKNKWTRQLALRMMGERQETALLPKLKR